MLGERGDRRCIAQRTPSSQWNMVVEVLCCGDALCVWKRESHWGGRIIKKTSTRPKWMLLTGLHKALTWIENQIWRSLREICHKRLAWDSLSDVSETCWKWQKTTASYYPAKKATWLTISIRGLIILTMVVFVKLFCFYFRKNKITSFITSSFILDAYII